MPLPEPVPPDGLPPPGSPPASPPFATVTPPGRVAAAVPSDRRSPDTPARDGRFRGGAPRRDRPCCAAAAPPRGRAASTGASSGDWSSPAPLPSRSAAAAVPTPPCVPAAIGTASFSALRSIWYAFAPGIVLIVFLRACATDLLSSASLFSRDPTAE